MHMPAMTLAARIKAYLNSLALKTLVSDFIRKLLEKDVKPLSGHITCSIVLMIFDELRNGWEDIIFCYIILSWVIFFNLIMQNISIMTSEINKTLEFSVKIIYTINLLKFHYENIEKSENLGHSSQLRMAVSSWDTVSREKKRLLLPKYFLPLYQCIHKK